MIALEGPETLEALVDPRCDGTQLSCLGVALGDPATAVARDRVVEVTFSPLVKGLMVTASQPPQYGGFDGKSVDADDVWASVAYGSGVLHTDADVSFSILRGRVAKFSLYGRWLTPFAHLDTVAKLYQRFGAPDRCLRLEADGDLIAYDSYYSASKKWVRWLAASKRPTVVMFGGEANAVREGKRGSVVRQSEHTGAN